MDSFDDAGTRNRLRNLTDDAIPADHMDRMMGTVIQRAERNERMKRRYRRTAAVFGGGVLLLLILLVTPISHTVRIGSLVTAEWAMAAEANDLEERIDEITGALSRGEGVTRTKVGLKDSMLVAQVAYRDLDAGEACDRVQALLADLGCSLQEVNLATRNITRSVGGSALASVASVFVRVKITGLTEEEISEALEQELAEYGDFETVVQIESEGDAQVIDIYIAGETFEEPQDGDDEQTITIELIDEGD